jgi:dienelactone hydrolase
MRALTIFIAAGTIFLAESASAFILRPRPVAAGFSFRNARDSVDSCLPQAKACGYETAPDELPKVEVGKLIYRSVGDEAKLPERYQLDNYAFAWKLTPKRDLPASGVEIFMLSFPSPVKSAEPANNTVWAEYYRPKGKGPFPGVLVLDILAGDQELSRIISRQLAQDGIAALFVQMPYYGPRRTPKGQRLLMPNIDHSLAAIGQTVCDCRCAAAWLETRPEVDPKQLGILGTSLGSFMGALTAAMEPRLGRVVLLLGGGGLVDAFYDHPKAKPYTDIANLLGLTKEKLHKLIAPADPLTYAASLKQRQLLMIAASRDDIVPPQAAKTLWEASGKPKIIWLDSTHVGAAIYIFDVFGPIVAHLKGK